MQVFFLPGAGSKTKRQCVCSWNTGSTSMAVRRRMQAAGPHVRNVDRSTALHDVVRYSSLVMRADSSAGWGAAVRHRRVL